MKKFLLSALVAIIVATPSFSENTLYEPFDGQADDKDLTLTGGVYNVSANGKWAVSYDDYYKIGSYWNIDDPETFTVLPQRGLGYDVSDAGVIGAVSVTSTTT